MLKFLILSLFTITMVSCANEDRKVNNDYVNGFEDGYMTHCLYVKSQGYCRAEVNRVIRVYR